MCTHSRRTQLWDQEDAQEIANTVPDQPNIWSDGSMEPILHLGVEVAGAGVFTHRPAFSLTTIIGVMRRT